jgi:hypothetical protein
MCLYAVLVWRGLVIARRAPDMLGTLLASGMAFWIGIEALINMSVMVGLMPFAGNALPFISAGGSNLVSTLCAIGIMLNISRQSSEGQGWKITNGGHSVRLLICAGGTGGGVYPALAVHSALTTRLRDVDTLWVGGEGGMEEALVKRQGIDFQSIPPPVCMVSVLPCRATLKLARGVFAARSILNEFKPDVMFFTGGYVAVPMAVAGRSIPSLLYVPDIEPGMALKSLAGLSDAIAVTTEQSQRFFKKK